MRNLCNRSETFFLSFFIYFFASNSDTANDTNVEQRVPSKTNRIICDVAEDLSRWHSAISNKQAVQTLFNSSPVSEFVQYAVTA